MREIKGDWGIKIPDEERPLEIEVPGEITRMSCPFDNHSESYEFTDDEASYGQTDKKKRRCSQGSPTPKAFG